MSAPRLCPALAWVALAALPAAAADLSAIPRTIVKEPAYSHSPGYVLLVFGEEAKTRVWVVFDGDRAYVDRNRNGDLTDDPPVARTKDSVWFDLGSVPDADGKTVHASPRLSTRSADRPQFQVRFPIKDRYEQWVRYSPLGAKPAEAPVVHLDGPLQVGFLGDRDDQKPIRTGADMTIVRGQEDEQSVWIGTPNFGKDVMPSAVNFRCSSSALNIARAGKDDRPLLTVSFPARDPRGPPVVKEIRLTGD